MGPPLPHSLHRAERLPQPCESSPPEEGISLRYLVNTFWQAACESSWMSDPSFHDLKKHFWLTKMYMRRKGRFEICAVNKGDENQNQDEHHSGLVSGQRVDISPPIEGLSEVYTKMTRRKLGSWCQLHRNYGDCVMNKDPIQLPGIEVRYQLQPQGFNGSYNKRCSILKTLDLQHRGPAEVYLSWVWSYKLSDVLYALMQAYPDFMSKDVFIWICFFINDQNSLIVSQTSAGSANLKHTFESRLKKVGEMLIILDDWIDPAYTRRIWTVYETFEARQLGISPRVTFTDSCQDRLSFLLHQMPVPDIIKEVAKSVRSEDAEAWDPADAKNIKDEIRRRFEGDETPFANVDESVRQGIKSAVKDRILQLFNASVANSTLSEDDSGTEEQKSFPRRIPPEIECKWPPDQNARAQAAWDAARRMRHPDRYKKQLCPHSQSGCRLAEWCSFAHSQAELREQGWLQAGVLVASPRSRPCHLEDRILPGTGGHVDFVREGGGFGQVAMETEHAIGVAPEAQVDNNIIADDSIECVETSSGTSSPEDENSMPETVPPEVASKWPPGQIDTAQVVWDAARWARRDPSKYKTKMCNFLRMPCGCRLAEWCSYAHGQAELRMPEW